MKVPSALPLLLLLAALSPCPALLAKPDADLSRRTPVPANQPIPVADFFRPALVRIPKLNPAGTHVAALFSTEEDHTGLVVISLADKKSQAASGIQNERYTLDIVNFDWLGDSRLIFSCARDKIWVQGLYAADLGRIQKPIPLIVHSQSFVLSRPDDAPNHPLIWLRQHARDHEREDRGVLQIDASLTTSLNPLGASILAPILRDYPLPPEETRGYITTKEGHLFLAFCANKGVPSLWKFQEKSWVKCAFDFDKWEIIDAGDAPDECIAASIPLPGEPSRLVRMNAVTGQVSAELLSSKDCSLTRADVVRRGRDNHITAIAYERKLPALQWFDEDYKTLQASLEASLPNRLVRILSEDTKQEKFIVGTRSDLAPDEYFLFDRKAVKLSPIESTRPWIDPSRMCPMQGLSYKSRDGLTINAYITLPAGADKAHPAPLVVYPHGGPFVRDHWGWNPTVQFLASRGYAVFQPNYRGSDGYDWSYAAQDPLTLRRMHDDVTDGTQALIRSGLVDPKRIAIMGGSFGGYLAISGVVNEPDLYRCAITIAGVFDWEKFMKEAKYRDDTGARYYTLKRHLGDPAKDKEAFDAIAPLRHVENIKVPVLVAHGDEDRTAYLSESRALISELKKHKVTYEALIEEGEGHGFQNLENKIELYSAIEAFLAKNLAPRASTRP